MNLAVAARSSDADRMQRLMEACLAGDDAVVVLIDRTRAISFMRGFGLSPCQMELLGVQIEENVRGLLTDADPAPAERRA